MEFYIMIGTKITVGFLCLLIFLNISGRSQLAPISSADQIGNYVLGGIIGGVIYNSQISILEMIIVIGIWGAFILITRFLKNKNRTAKKLIDGQSVLVFEDDTIKTQSLNLAGRTVRDFIAGLHMQDIHKLDEVEKVWLEPNGHYTVSMKGQPPYAIALIEDGQVVKESLIVLGHDKKWLRNKLKELGAKKISDIVYAEWYRDEGEADKKTIRVYYYDGKMHG